MPSIEQMNFTTFFRQLFQMRREVAYQAEVQIQRLAPDVPLPTYHSLAAAGMDLHAAIASDLVLQSGQIVSIPCGFAIALPEHVEAQIRSRSGLASKHGIAVLNAPGTIDADYRGEVQIILINLSGTPFTISRGMRVAQMVIAPVFRALLKEVDRLPATIRGAGGFGHTGR